MANIVAGFGVPHTPVFPFFVKRDGPLLFLSFTSRAAYVIDIMMHGDWTRDHVLEVLASEWPHEGVIHEIKGAPSASQLTEGAATPRSSRKCSRIMRREGSRPKTSGARRSRLWSPRSRTARMVVNVSEYLESLCKAGISEADLPAVQPIGQARVWERFRPGDGVEKLADLIHQLEREDSRFHMEGGSWTNNISWVKGYENILGPMQKLSSLFFEKALKPGVPASDPRFRNALFHLLVSQTSCYRYWRQGAFVDYGREICRRGIEILTRRFLLSSLDSKVIAPEVS